MRNVLQNFLRRSSHASMIGIVLFGIGLTIIAGWLSRQPVWQIIFPSGTAMVIATAFCLVLGGISLICNSLPSNAATRIRIIAGLCIVVISGLMLLENVFHVDLGVSLPQLHRWFADGNPAPGRMAPNTALALLITGVALLSDNRKHQRVLLRRVLAAMVITLGVLGIIGYLLILDLAYGWFRFPRMALSTGISVILFGAALLIDQPYQDRDHVKNIVNAESGIHIFLGVAVIVLLAIVMVSYGSIRALDERSEWVAHSYQVRVEFDNLIADFRSALRLPTIDGRTVSAEALRSRLGNLGQLIADNPAQSKRLATIRAQMEREVSAAEARQPLADPMLTTRFAALSRLVQEFKQEETRLLDERQIESRQSSASAKLVIIAGNVIGFAILLLASLMMQRQNRLRSELEHALQQANLQLEAKVTQRTQELAHANDVLAEFNTSLEQHIALRTAELEDLYNHSPCGYHSVDATGTFIHINDTELEWLGYRRDEVLGHMRHHDIHTEASLQIFLQVFPRFLQTGFLQDQEFEYRRKDGSTFTVSLNATAVRDADGKFVMSRTTLYDISARKQAEREIQLLNDNLRQQAATLEISNRELESFSYSISHDLRAPLRAIDGYALMLEEDYASRVDAEGQRYLSVIRKNSQRMGMLIDDLLGFSRLGRQAISPVPIEMNRLVQEVIVDAMQGEDSQRIAIELEPLPQAQADRALLRQVWMNLISNAIKYSGKSAAPRIRISGTRNAADITYAVSDNGVGFNMAYYDKLFGVFQRLHHASEFAGTGVGLAIVQRIVLRHGGRVWAEAEEGQGATFYFSLPIGVANARI